MFRAARVAYPVHSSALRGSCSPTEVTMNKATLGSGAGRRRFLELTLAGVWCARAATRATSAPSQHEHKTAHTDVAGGPTAERALAELKAGNARFVGSAMRHGHQDTRWRTGLATGQ